MDNGPIAYLTGDYPKVSHTFILREVEAVRAAGVKVITCSIRQPPEAEFKGQEELRARAETFYVKPAARNPSSIPMPRLPITCPTSASENPICCCSSGGSSTIGVKFSMP